jgi:hypothetical protein
VNPTEIQVNECVGIAWSTGGGTSNVTIKRNGQIVQGNAGLSGQEQDCLGAPGTYNYQLVALDDQGQTEAQDINVQVLQSQLPTSIPVPQATDTTIPNEPVTIISFFADPSLIDLNNGCTLLEFQITGPVAMTQLTRTDEGGNSEKLSQDVISPFRDCPDASLVGQVLSYQLDAQGEFMGAGADTAFVQVTFVGG